MMDIFEDSKELQEPIIVGPRECNTTGELRNMFLSMVISGRFPNLIFLLLTKRPENIIKCLSNWVEPCDIYTLENIWFGTSISSNKTIKYADILREQTMAHTTFISIEPQVGPIDINELGSCGIGWVIQGGESAKGKHRPFEIEWAYTMRDFCKANDIPYFFKQIDKVQEIPEDLQIREFPEF